MITLTAYYGAHSGLRGVRVRRTRAGGDCVATMRHALNQWLSDGLSRHDFQLTEQHRLKNDFCASAKPRVRRTPCWAAAGKPRLGQQLAPSHVDAPNSNWRFTRHPACSKTTGPQRWICTPNGYSVEGLKLFTLANACGMLASKNLTTIHMIGDSFVRHAYIALGMVLADDYGEAMLVPDWRARVAVLCGGDAIFGEKECRPLLRKSVRVCHGGRVTLTFKEHGQASPAMLREISVVVWGDSNHPVDMNYTSRCGIHDADIFTRAILEPRCPAIVAQNLSAKLVWLGTHRRLGPVNGRWAEPHFDEELESVHAFLRQLGPVLGCLCGVSRFVDTWGFTSALVRQLPRNESEALTFDGVHWQRAVNVIKAHLLLKAILGGTEP